MSNLGWLAAGFVVVWMAIGIYVLRLARAQRDITRRLDEIERDATRPPAS